MPDVMRPVKAAAKQQFETVDQVEGIRGYGVDTDGHTLLVYVCDPSVTRRLPAEFQGHPLKCVVIEEEIIAV